MFCLPQNRKCRNLFNHNETRLTRLLQFRVKRNMGTVKALDAYQGAMKFLAGMIKHHVKALLFSLTIVFLWLAAAGCASLKKVNPVTRNYYDELKTELIAQGYQPSVRVISGKRSVWFNKILTWFGAQSAASISKAMR